MSKKRISKTKLANKIAKLVKADYALAVSALMREATTSNNKSNTSKRSRYHWIEDALDYEEE